MKNLEKIWTIISREYSTRVKKKSFIIMSIIGPVLFASLMIAPAWMSQMEDTEVKVIAVADSSHLFYKAFPETDYIKFEYLPDADIVKYKHNYNQSQYYAILYISHIIVNTTNAVILYSDKSPGLSVRMHISNAIEKKLEHEKLKAYNIDEHVLNAIQTNITIRSVKLNELGEEKENNFTLAMIIGYLVGFIIYFTIMFSGTQVMRGVIEEKTSRIIEVIISSVKPFQLMLGKIIGIGLVALTQFVLWGVLTIGLYTTVAPFIMPDVSEVQKQMQVQNIDSGSSLQAHQPVQEDVNPEIRALFVSLTNINFGTIIFSFLFFFIGGYFLYAAMFAAVGSAIDGETDTQQFVLPVTIPLMLGMIVMINTVQNPESALSYWCSLIPFTSPIVMMARIPFGVPISQVLFAALLLIITFIVFTWLAGKVYRTGILMYGKKSSWREILKWINYKN